jgi:hypothetical protein
MIAGFLRHGGSCPMSAIALLWVPSFYESGTGRHEVGCGSYSGATPRDGTVGFLTKCSLLAKL